MLIFSENSEEHSRHIRVVLKHFQKNNLYIKLEKCKFEKTQMQFLEYIISPNGLSMDPNKIKAILDWPIPRNLKKVQCLIGFANFYRKFIKDFSKVISPITSLTKKVHTFSWSPETQVALEKLKTLFTSAPVLIQPRPALPFVVDVNASDSTV
ncbi:uncharacterized protein [Eleutherodactylus coqui]|uniref:uncharacterized protein n=1 Tax=Eleutherodactylus coqui TaxID=57060 RepID=UPI0034620756